MADITVLIENVKNTRAAFEAAQAELAEASKGLKDALRAAGVTGVVGGNKTGAGRPRGSSKTQDGNTVVNQVLAFIKDRGEKGASRAELLVAIPGHDAAVQAAIRVHQLAKRVENRDHRWYITATGEQLTLPESTNESAVA
jgi:hypothetical protein